MSLDMTSIAHYPTLFNKERNRAHFWVKNNPAAAAATLRSFGMICPALDVQDLAMHSSVHFLLHISVMVMTSFTRLGTIFSWALHSYCIAQCPESDEKKAIHFESLN